MTELEEKIMELADWDEDWDDEMGVAGAFVLAFTAAGIIVIVTSAAIIWNVAEVAAQGLRALRRK